MDDLQDLPLFPLKTVLFPGMVLPLHIFEPRYKQMIGMCIKENKPFGVVLIREGEGVGKAAVPFDIGTTAYITEVDQLEDGRMNIKAVGYQRFKIHSIKHEQPYSIGVVETYNFGDESPEVSPSTLARVSSMLQEYFDLLQAITGKPLSDELTPKSDGQTIAYLTAITLPLSLEEKQKLLEARSLFEMVSMEYRLLKRELMLLKHINKNQASARFDPDVPFSLN